MPGTSFRKGFPIVSSGKRSGFRGGPTQEQVDAEHQLLAETQGPVLAWCRSGNRSIVTWTIGEALAGTRSRQELIQLAAGAGCDLSGLLG